MSRVTPRDAPHDALWDALRSFDIDEPDVHLTFHARLARENGWSALYARRVVEEYRRFVFLAMSAGHVVTPSEQVDQAWHLHLVYTRSYWDRMCGAILQRPLHHGPTQGGADEDAKHRAQYAQTISSYARIFGEEPPRDIWPSVDRRFGADLEHRNVWTSTCLVIPHAVLAWTAVAAVVLAVAGAIANP